MTGSKGIGSWLAYARSKGKKLTIPEWAVMNGHPDGGGDNAYFVQKMFRFFEANAADIGYECYFNYNTPTFTHKLQNNPAAAKKYRWLY